MSGAEAMLEHLVGAGGAMWRASWQASVLAALVVAVQLALGKRIAARWRHAMWMLVLVRLALPVVPSSPVSVFNLAPVKAPVVRSAEVTIEPAPIAWSTTPLTDAVPPLDFDELSRVAALRIDAPSSAKPQAAVMVAPTSSPNLWAGWPQVLAALWALGAALLALRIAYATWRVSRTLRTLDPVDDAAVCEVLRATAAELGVRRLPLLLSGEGLFSPALVGFVRPRLLVPRDLLRRFNPAELRLIFLHELAHLKRHDVAINWASTLLTVLHWPNPVAWLVMWRLRLERELACDELVMSRTSDTDRRAYGHTIVKLLEAFSHGGAVAAHRPPVGGIGIVEGKAQMKRRIVMIAQFAKSSRTWTVVAACLVLALGLVALTDAVAAEVPAKPISEPTLRQKTMKMADGTVFATNEYERVEARGDAYDPQASVNRLHEAEAQRDAARRKLGEQHPQVQALQAEINQLKAALASVQAAATRPTKISRGELVTVSIMDLVGQGVETVKTARVDGDGTINLPYAGQVEVSGLSPRELEKAVAKALQEKGIVQNAFVVVSMPALGESHQLAKVRQAAPAPTTLDPAMMEDPAMMGIEMGFGMPPAGVAEEDPATKALLSRKVPELKLDGVPFVDVIDFFRDTMSANVFVNWRALEAQGIDRSAPVTMRLNNVAFRDVLSLLTREVGQGAMTYKVENGVIVIDVAPHAVKPAKLVTEAYNVSALLGGGTEEQLKSKLVDLQRVIISNVQPQTWNKGASHVSAFDLRLIITASEEVHRDVKQLLKLLERNGGKPVTTEPSPAGPGAVG